MITKTRLSILSLITAVVFSTSALAAIPAVFWLGSLALHAAAASIYFTKSTVKASAASQPINVYVKVDKTKDIQDIGGATPPDGFQATLPAQQVTRSLKMTESRVADVSIPSQSGYPGGTITGASIPEFIAKVGTLSQPPYRYGSSSTGVNAPNVDSALQYSQQYSVRYRAFFLPAASTAWTSNLSRCSKGLTTCSSYSSFDFITNSSTDQAATSDMQAGVEIVVRTSASASTSSHFFLPLSQHVLEDCPSGYSPNATNFLRCDLNAPEEVVTQNGVCEINPFNPTPAQLADPDCQSLKSSGAVSEVLDDKGNPTTVVKSPADPSVPTIAVKARSPSSGDPGGVTVSQSVPDPNTGGVKREDVVYDDNPDPTKSPTLREILSQLFPQNPPPSSPDISTPASGLTGGMSQAACGGPGQTPCTINGIDGLQSSLDGIKAGVNHLGDGNATLIFQGSAIAENTREIADALKPSAEGSDPVLTDPECPDCDDNSLMRDNVISGLLDFKDFTLTPNPVTCSDVVPEYQTSISLFDHQFDIDLMGGGCSILDEYQPLISQIFTFIWTILAVLIFVGKLE